MTELRDMQGDRGTEVATADRELEVKPEVIQDLDLADEDADDIRGGRCAAEVCGISYLPGITYVTF